MKLRCVALLYVLFAIQPGANAQNNGEITLMDFVKIKEGKRSEALYFYEHNWKLYREEALKRKIIVSYEIVEAKPDSVQNFNLILITRYKDSVQYKNSELNFQPILKAIRPNGPLLLNELKPADFRENVFVKTFQTLYANGKKKRKK